MIWENSSELLAPPDYRDTYRWVKNLSEMPEGWEAVMAPSKPGAESYDVAVYTVTETARFRTASAAGAMVAGKVNKIGTPTETFVSDTGGWNWKCDGAEVSWSGKYWLARLTWTRSGDENGWDEDLYGDGGGDGDDGGDSDDRDENSQ